VHPSVRFVATSDTIIPVPTDQLIERALKRHRCEDPSQENTFSRESDAPTDSSSIEVETVSSNNESSDGIHPLSTPYSTPSDNPDPEPPPAPILRERSAFDVEDFGDPYPKPPHHRNHLLVTFQNIGPQPQFLNSDKAQINVASFRRSRPDIALFAEHDLNPSKLSDGHRFADRQIRSVPGTRSYIVNNIHEKDRHSYSQWGGELLGLSASVIPPRSAARAGTRLVLDGGAGSV